MRKIFNYYRLLVLTLVMSIVIGSMSFFAFGAQGDEVRAAKKIISIVYDDSGSMLSNNGNPWGYANYATQGLMALLNEQDELYITYLSEPSKSKKIDLSDIAGAVSDMQNWEESQGTPAEAIYTAADTLIGCKEEDPSIEYWLIVMTDGGFSSFRDQDDLQGLLSKKAGSEMPNRSSLRVAYFGMGTGAEKVTPDNNAGLYSWHSDSEDSIIAGVSDMARTVSGRIEVDNAKQDDDHTISFSSELPLYSISVLSQSSKAVVTDAKTDEETLNIIRNIGLDSNTKKSPDLKINGNAAVINKIDKSGDTNVIPPGSYYISFSDAIDIHNIVIQYEPAIGLMAELKREGIRLDLNKDLVRNGEILDVSFTPVVPGTEDEIAANELPAGISWDIVYRVDSAEKDQVNNRELTGIRVDPGKNEIICTMHIPGFSDVVTSIVFDVEDSIVITNLGIETEQPESLSYERDKLGNKIPKESEHVRFWLTSDGNVLSKEELEEVGIGLEVADVLADDSDFGHMVKLFGIKTGDVTLRQNEDGSYELIPYTAWKLPFTRPLTKAGNYIVTVKTSTDNSITAQGMYEIKPAPGDWIDIIILLLLLVLILYLLHTWLIRERFPRCTIRCAKIDTSGEYAYRRDRPAQQIGLAQSLWPPFKKHSICKCKAIPGLVLVAEYSGVSLKGKSLVRAGFNCIGKYTGKIPTAKHKSELSSETIMNKATRIKPDEKGKIQISNQQVPSGANLLLFCSCDKNGRKRNLYVISSK